MSSSFITRIEHEKREPYAVIFQTDDKNKYLHIENECRKMLDHSKPKKPTFRIFIDEFAAEGGGKE